MSITLGVPGPNPPGVDPCLHRTGSWIARLELQAPLDVLEVPADVGDHHVPDGEFGRGMAGLQDPFRHHSPR